MLAGALARGDTGIDFEGGRFAFLESPVFLLLVLVLAVLAYLAERQGRTGGADERRTATEGGQGADGRRRREPVESALGAIAVGLGALLFAGSLEGAGREGWPGLIAGAACAALGYFAVAALFGAARRRVEGGAAALLTAQADLVALVLAALAIFVEPVGFLALAAFVFLIVRARSAGGGKYEGLRILR